MHLSTFASVVPDERLPAVFFEIETTLANPRMLAVALDPNSGVPSPLLRTASRANDEHDSLTTIRIEVLYRIVVRIRVVVPLLRPGHRCSDIHLGIDT